MKKRNLILIVPTLLLTQTMGDNSAEYQEMMDAMNKVNKKQEVVFERMRDRVENVEQARKTSLVDGNLTENIHAQIAAANGMGNIATSVAKVEIEKIKAKDAMIREIDGVEKAKAEGNVSKVESETLEAKAVSNIAQSVSAVESSKLDAVDTIADVTEKVEIAKTTPADTTLVSPESALSIAKSVAAVKVAKAVSAVEITKAVSDVENAQANGATMDFPRKSLMEVEAEARAIIAQEVAKVEIAKANALAIIAKAVASVEIAKAREEIKVTEGQDLDLNETDKELF